MGRRKIEMKMVKDSSSRQVTFSKRRNGIFKKANELATLCAAQIAILVFSPGGKLFSFGHPSVDSVVDRFLNQDKKQKKVSNPGGTPPADNPRRKARMGRLNKQFNELAKELHEEKKRGEKLEKAIKATNNGKKMKPFEEMGVKELLRMKGAMEDLRRNIKTYLSASATEREVSSSLLLLSKGPVFDDAN